MHKTRVHKDQNRQFAQKVELVRECIRIHGKLPEGKLQFKGVMIGIWVKNQRYKYAKKQLSEDRIRQLESVPGWFWNGFDEQVYLVRECIRNFGVLPAHNCIYKEKMLGSWIATCCKNYNDKKLTQEQVQKLESLPGWKWKFDEFSHKVSLLGEYIYGHNLVPTGDTYFRGVNLYAWMQECEKDFRNNNLTSEQIQQLKALPRWQFGEDVPAKCKVCSFNGSISHSCTHVMNFNNLKRIPVNILFLHSQACLKCEVHDDFAFYLYWFHHLSKFKAPTPFPVFQYLRDVDLQFCRILAPFRQTLHDTDAMSEAIEKIKNEKTKQELQRSYQNFIAASKRHFDHISNRKTDEVDYLLSQYTFIN